MAFIRPVTFAFGLSGKDNYLERDNGDLEKKRSPKCSSTMMVAYRVTLFDEILFERDILSLSRDLSSKSSSKREPLLHKRQVCGLANGRVSLEV